jgi:hypothetical protein
MEGLAAAPGRAGKFKNLGLTESKTFNEGSRAEYCIY